MSVTPLSPTESHMMPSRNLCQYILIRIRWKLALFFLKNKGFWTFVDVSIMSVRLSQAAWWCKKKWFLMVASSYSFSFIFTILLHLKFMKLNFQLNFSLYLWLYNFYHKRTNCTMLFMKVQIVLIKKKKKVYNTWQYIQRRCFNKIKLPKNPGARNSLKNTLGAQRATVGNIL